VFALKIFSQFVCMALNCSIENKHAIHVDALNEEDRCLCFLVVAGRRTLNCGGGELCFDVNISARTHKATLLRFIRRPRIASLV
jgi:hypothetical protein